MSEGSHKPKFVIPSRDQVEQARRQQGKQQTLFFKRKTQESAEDRLRSTSDAAGTSTTNVSSSTASVTSPPSSSLAPAPFEPATSTPTASYTSTPALQTIESTKPKTSSPSTTTSATPSTSQTAPLQPTARRIVGNAILVSSLQYKNPILKYVHNVPWEPDDSIRCDYLVGQTTGVLYLSLRYHRIHPEYILDRMSRLARLYVLRVLLVLVDVDDYHDVLRELNRSAILNDYTLMLAWSFEEAARYLETYKAFENKPPDLIREKVTDDYNAKATDTLTQIRSVNKTDVITLLSTFGSIEGIAKATSDQLAMCPGFGEQKVKRLQQAFTTPFVVKDRSKRRRTTTTTTSS